MSDFVSALTNSTSGISADNLWSQVSSFAPFLIILFIFAFGYRIARKSIKSGVQGKVNI